MATKLILSNKIGQMSFNFLKISYMFTSYENVNISEKNHDTFLVPKLDYTDIIHC